MPTRHIRPTAYDHAKRAMDVAASAAAFAVLGPLMIGTGVAVRATMGAPVLFRQKRPGLGGTPFELMKFRTMREARESESGPEHDAARVTRLGRFLRATSLDELPTLINVLRGDMSLVGPRPLLMRYLPRYSPAQARRHEVKPGVTGWAQVNGRNAISWDQKFALDVWYVDHRALMLDLKIIFKTIETVLRRSGVSADNHVTMPEFFGADEAE